MSNIIEVPQFFKLAMLRMSFCLVCLVLALTSKAAKSDECTVAPCLNIWTSRIAFTGSDWLYPNQFHNDVALASSEGNNPVENRTISKLKLELTSEPKGGTSMQTSARGQIVSSSNRALLHLVLRFESKGERLDIKPRRHSILAVWRKELF